MSSVPRARLYRQYTSVRVIMPPIFCRGTLLAMVAACVCVGGGAGSSCHPSSAGGTLLAMAAYVCGAGAMLEPKQRTTVGTVVDSGWGAESS